MPRTSPHLSVRRPSPTTAEFVVTTRPHLTIPVRLFLFSVLLARCLLTAAVVLLLSAEWNVFMATHYDENAQPNGSTGVAAEQTWTALVRRAVDASPLGQLAARAVALTPVWAILLICTGLSYIALLPLHTTESLLVLRGLGIQTYSSGPTSLGRPAFLSIPSYSVLDTNGGWWDFLSRIGGLSRGLLTSSGVGERRRFIPTEKIRDVLINEAFKGFEVRYCLVIVVEGEEDLVVVFPKLLPGRRTVEEVWRGLRACLYEPDGARKVDEKG
jgi:phosphatidylinositol N-acetylglucosaminyltransferase subunit H